MINELNEKELGVISRVQKLLALAGNNPNEAEAQSAAEMAMKLLEAYNLDMSAVERMSGASKRSDSHLKGGLYKWQRDLWEEVSKLNWCMYWSVKGLAKGSTYQHRILGRGANVRTTEIMATYLQEAVERLAREWAGHPTSYFTKPAISYREGMAHRVVQRLAIRREEQLAEERRKKAEEATKARHPGYTPSTALVLADVAEAEKDANMDYLYGEGYSARQRAARAEAEAAYEARLVARKKWEEENPEEAAKQQAELEARYQEYLKKEEKLAKRRKGQPVRYKAYKGDASAYQAGFRKGDDIGIDQQIGHNKTKGVGN